MWVCGFYINGVPVSDWFTYWPIELMVDLKTIHENWEQEIGPCDVYKIYTRIDHHGVETASAEVFRYSVQELLLVLFYKKEAVLNQINEWAPNQSSTSIYEEMIEAAFVARRLSLNVEAVFWGTGTEELRMRILDEMRRAALPKEDTEFLLPVHERMRQAAIEANEASQLRHMRRYASSGGVKKDLRKRLLSL